MKLFKDKMPHTKLLLLELSKKMWPKVTGFALLGMVSALAAIAFKDMLPQRFSTVVEAETLSDILTILASSMLAVTTFSLSTMVAAYSAATSAATPRAAGLITEDRTTQNALSTFLGSFLFSLVGIIALSMGIYEGNGRFILYAVTLCVIVLIVIMFIQWIERLTSLGRVSETCRLVEKAAMEPMRQRAVKPTFGCNRLETLPGDTFGQTLTAQKSGYVTYIDAKALSVIAVEHDTDVYIVSMPGRYVTAGTNLALASRAMSEEVAKAACGCFSVAETRAFEQDPRFGLCVLTEIASRAASEAVRDKGTAIDVIGRLSRVLEVYATQRKEPDSVDFPRLWIPELLIDDLFQDAFPPIAREGACAYEVHVRLQKALVYLATLSDDFRLCAARHSEMAMRYAEEHIFLEEEKAALRTVARQVYASGKNVLHL